MKKLIIIGICVLVVIFGIWYFWSLSFNGVGPFSSASCGSVFEDGFKKAVEQDDVNFCSNFDQTSLKQYKNNEGYDYCSPPIIGKMKSAQSIAKGGSFKGYCSTNMAIATGDVANCKLGNGYDELCVVLIAASSGNKGYCDLIKTDGIRQGCQSRGQ